MRNRSPASLVFALVLLGAALHARPVAAQLAYGADVGLASQYVWRGLTIVNRPVLQPGLWTSYSFGESATVTLSLWGNVELGRYDGRSALSEGGGAHAFDLTEIDPTLEVAVPLGRFELVAGASGYLYPNSHGYTFEDNAAEVYGTVSAPSVWGLEHRFGVWYDVTAIDGAYLEAGLARRFALRRDVELAVSAAIGWSAGQAAEYDDAGEEREPGNFEHDGFTHAELAVALPVTRGPFTIEPSAHLVVAHDDWAKVASATRERDVKLWFGVVASFSGPGDD